MSLVDDVDNLKREEKQKLLRQVRRDQKKILIKSKIKKWLKWLGKEILHILLTFIVGVAIATAYHELVTNKSVRSTAERICEVYGRDEQECKDGIDDVLDVSDNEVQNNIEIKGE